MAYSNYPKGAVSNAKRALKFAEENGWGSCGTPVGKQRANQIANRRPLSKQVVKRVYSFLSRHAKNADVPYGEGCGGLMYDAWGGKAMLPWARARVSEMEERALSATARKGLQNKIKEHNESVSVSYKKATLPMLEKVYNRGVGAFNTNPGSVRPSVKTPEQWAMARVNSFLYALKNERFRKGRHDTDLFPKGHKLRGDMEEKMDNIEFELREQYGDAVESRVVELRAADGDEQRLLVEGYAAKYDDVTNIGYFNEKIERGAFDEVLENDVRFLLNHKGMPLARTVNGTLKLEARDEGLYTRAELSNTTQGRDVYEAIKRGDISQMSFAFTIAEDRMDTKTNTRTIKRVKEMFDVSAVSFPAYPTTTIEARQKAAQVAETPEVVEEVSEPAETEKVAERSAKQPTSENRTFVSKSPQEMNLNDLKGQRAAYYEEFVEIGKLADTEGRAMTEAEQERADTLDSHINDIDAKIKHKQREQEMVARMAQSSVSSSTSEDKEVSSINYRYSISRAINAIRNGRSLEGAEAEWTAEAAREMRGSGVNLAGQIGIPAFALLRAGTADDFQAASGDGSGFVATDVPGAIEALRAPTVLQQLGSQVIQAQGNIKMPRVSNKATAPNANEVAAATSAGMELDEVNLTPQRASTFTTYSKVLLTQGGPQVDNLIANDLRAALNEKVDVQGFTNILAATGINDLTTSGTGNTDANATLAVGMEAAVLADGGDLSAASYVFSPAAFKFFKQAALVPSVMSMFDPGTGRFNGYNMVATPHLGDATANTIGKAIFGNFRQGVMMAFFGGIDLLVDPFTAAQTGQVKLHATRYYDVEARQPEALCICSDVEVAA